MKPTIVAIILSIAIPFLGPEKSKKTETVYGVLYTDANYYYIYDDLVLRVEGEHYVCEQDTKACTIASIATPDQYGRIPKIAGSVLRNGYFVPFF